MAWWQVLSEGGKAGGAVASTSEAGNFAASLVTGWQVLTEGGNSTALLVARWQGQGHCVSIHGCQWKSLGN